MGERARQVFEQQAGATARSIEALREILDTFCRKCCKQRSAGQRRAEETDMKRPLLLPLVPLYAAGLALRELRLSRGWEPIRRLRFPVISIGNLSTGGSGKTPLTITLARLLSARGFHVDVLSRGYGRSSREPARVLPDGTAEQYGDEPLLIAREAGVPVYVAAERYDAGLLAESNYIPRRDSTAGSHPRRRLPAPPALIATSTSCSSTVRTGTTTCCPPEIFARR